MSLNLNNNVISSNQDYISKYNSLITKINSDKLKLLCGPIKGLIFKVGNNYNCNILLEFNQNVSINFDIININDETVQKITINFERFKPNIINITNLLPKINYLLKLSNDNSSEILTYKSTIKTFINTYYNKNLNLYVLYGNLPYLNKNWENTVWSNIHNKINFTNRLTHSEITNQPNNIIIHLGCQNNPTYLINKLINSLDGKHDIIYDKDMLNIFKNATNSNFFFTIISELFKNLYRTSWNMKYTSNVLKHCQNLLIPYMKDFYITDTTLISTFINKLIENKYITFSDTQELFNLKKYNDITYNILYQYQLNLNYNDTINTYNSKLLNSEKNSNNLIEININFYYPLKILLLNNFSDLNDKSLFNKETLNYFNTYINNLNSNDFLLILSQNPFINILKLEHDKKDDSAFFNIPNNNYIPNVKFNLNKLKNIKIVAANNNNSVSDISNKIKLNYFTNNIISPIYSDKQSFAKLFVNINNTSNNKKLEFYFKMKKIKNTININKNANLIFSAQNKNTVNEKMNMQNNINNSASPNFNIKINNSFEINSDKKSNSSEINFGKKDIFSEISYIKPQNLSDVYKYNQSLDKRNNESSSTNHTEDYNKNLSASNSISVNTDSLLKFNSDSKTNTNTNTTTKLYSPNNKSEIDTNLLLNNNDSHILNTNSSNSNLDTTKIINNYTNKYKPKKINNITDFSSDTGEILYRFKNNKIDENNIKDPYDINEIIELDLINYKNIVILEK